MHWYFARVTWRNRQIEAGWMLAADDAEILDYARAMGYSVDYTYIGVADMSSVTPKLHGSELTEDQLVVFTDILRGGNGIQTH